jgi:CDP-diacylglycerol--serine O-phosphatidyltransferase
MMEENDDKTVTKLSSHPRLQKGIYIIPNLFTAAGMFLGFFAIIYTLRSVLLGREEFISAVYAIILAAVVDGIDGRLARAMKSESAFGEQFDSIADMVSFGVAPAVLSYGVALIHLDRLGMAGAFAFLACAAIRLARFNVIAQQVEGSQKYFRGMSSPVAAGGLAVCMYLLSEEISGDYFNYAILLITVFLGFLMISNIRFRTFKEFGLQHHKIQTFAFVIFLLLMVFTFRLTAMFWIFVSYVTWGFISEFIMWRRKRKSDPNHPFIPFGD